MRKDVYTIENILDKANDTFNNNYATFTNFLDLNDQSKFESKKKELPHINYLINGGYDDAERKTICFYPDYLEASDVIMPYSILKITSSGKDQLKLNHRDYLGAVLNLGINRDRVGDIICGNHGAYIIVLTEIKEYVINHLTRVKNSAVHVEEVGTDALEDYSPTFDVIKGTVSSLRIDNIIKLGFRLSRTKAVDLINASRVFLNSSAITKASSIVDVGDKVSVRKLGKIKLHSIGEMSKKGRTYVEIHFYK